MKFSIVIPTYNEGSQIAAALKRLRQISESSPVEIIVADGNSSDGTAEKAAPWADVVLSLESPNVGAQLDAGARKASGDLLVFFSAGLQPPTDWQRILEHFWVEHGGGGIAASVFGVDYGRGWPLRFASAWTNLRVRLAGLVSPDQGLCTTPEIYGESGGFPPLPFREHLVFCEKLKRLGSIVLLKGLVLPPARRLRRLGVWRFGMERAEAELRYRLGATPESLWQRYGDV